MRTLTQEAAGRIALAASGFSAPRPAAPNAGHLRRTFERLGLVQIDSVARVVRSHYLPFFSRLGPYDRATLDRLFHRAPRMGVEYWVHEAAYAPPSTIALLDGRRARWAKYGYGHTDPETGEGFRALMHALVDELAVGPATARELEARVDHDIPERDHRHWGWNPSRVKSALEALFRSGRISVAARNAHFEKVFALPEHVHPDLPRVPEFSFEVPDPKAPGAPRDDVLALVRRASVALGIGRYDCFADYYRLPLTPVKRAVESLVAAGELEPVEVARDRAFLRAGTRVPRKVEATALLAPFDPLVFNRKRIAWLFDFDYRIEIYTPAHKRVYGYYVLPFLHGDRLVGRVDLAADRKAEVLRVHGVYWEPGRYHPVALGEELERMRVWLGLARTVVSGGLPDEVARARPEPPGEEPAPGT
ncbi:winged helix-turn-helix domain-containing protein [Brevibacterium samyangense]|uniref:Winged helix-turn-helix domain-containing protein n=1 Tax=Brevibacterium samyangense TaxID=366888 RepID=A0ABP5EX22_9MICO